jgi:hypothetical protein
LFLCYPNHTDWEAEMDDRPFDRQAWVVLVFGWAVALWVTLA